MLTLGSRFYALLNIYNTLTVNLYCSLLFLYNKTLYILKAALLDEVGRIAVSLKSFKIRPVFKRINKI